ncbi:MAG TPA: 23S rRNA (guanosine(2251)-2'-O)-methyltransferase RlmB [Candidatus Paceibacterota bacterium]
MNQRTDGQSVIVYGKHAVLAVLAFNKKLVKAAWISRHLEGEDLYYKVRNALKSVKIELKEMTIGDLDRKAGVTEHQGIMVELSAYPFVSLEEFFAAEETEPVTHSLVVMLDKIEDPHNVGAIARTAVGMGARALIIPEHGQAPISGTVIKTSVGSIFSIPVIKVTNLARTLEAFKQRKYWTYGLDMGGKPVDEVEFAEKSVIVIGGEGEGLRQLTAETCDEVVSLPKSEALESYNASVSGAMAMYEYNRQTGLNK